MICTKYAPRLIGSVFAGAVDLAVAASVDLVSEQAKKLAKRSAKTGKRFTEGWSDCLKYLSHASVVLSFLAKYHFYSTKWLFECAKTKYYARLYLYDEKSSLTFLHGF
jgi:hypothetical protein